MSDTMLIGVLRMPFEMAMGDYSSSRQFWSRGQQAADRIEADAQTIERLTRERDAAETGAHMYQTMLTEARRLGFGSVIEAIQSAHIDAAISATTDGGKT